MSEKDVYIGKTSIQIGQHGFINQPKEIIEYIKYLQNQLQQKENIIKEEIQWYEKENKYNQEIIIKQEQELQQKENIIKEAREYIESYMPNYDFDKTNLIKLLEILQGSDDE